MPFYKPGDLGAIQKIADSRVPDNLTEAEVVSVLASGRLMVKLRGSNQIFPVDTVDGSKYSPGQKVTMMRSKARAGKWVILSTYASDGGSTVLYNAISPSGSTDPLSPPKNLSVISLIHAVILQWTPSGPRNDIIYEVQISSDADQTTILDTVQISGSSLTYTVPTGTTYYFAVRSIDVNWNRSGFSTVVGGTAVYPDAFGSDYTYDISFAAPGSTTPLLVSTEPLIKAISYIGAVQSSGMIGTWRVYIGSTDLITPDETDASYVGEAGYFINYRNSTGHALYIDLSGIAGSGTIKLKVTVNP